MQGQQSSPSAIVIALGVYKIVLAIFLLCAGAAAVGCGALGGLTASVFGRAGETQAAVATGVISLISTLVGIFSLAFGVAAIVVAIGLFLTKPWAYLGALVVNGAVIVLQLLGLFTGGLNILNVVFIVLSGVAIYLLLTDEPTKQVFGQA